MARPRIEIDISRVEELAAQGLTQAEICLVIGISEDTLSRRKSDLADLADAIKSGKAKAASEISNTLYKMARGGDLGAIVWYEKTRRGLSDKMANTNTNVSVDWETVPPELRDAFIEGRMTLDDVLRKL